MPGRSVTAEQLVRVLRNRGATLPAEISTFVVLEACEELIRRGPSPVSLTSITITEDGEVVLGAAKAWLDEASCARALHAALTTLLVAAGPAPTPALMRLIEEGPQGGSWMLAQLRDDLEAALVPLNRHASQRVLGRLAREVVRQERPSARPTVPTFQELDAQLSSFLGGGAPEPFVPTGRSAKERDLTVRDVVEQVDPSHDEVLFFDTDTRAVPTQDNETPTRISPAPPMPLPQASRPGRGGAARMESLPPRTSLRPTLARGPWLAGLLIALALGLLVATLVLRPELWGRLPGIASEAPQPAPPVAEPLVPPSAPRAGDLVVSARPSRAQIFRFVGKGPVTVSHLPVGVAHEFVALAEGLTPTRAVVPVDASWEQTPEGPRYELAMQLGAKLREGTSAEYLGESRLPSEMGAPRGELGRVRIVTTPQGAQVYQLVGFAPEARLENLPLDQAVELLVVQPGYAPTTHIVAPSDFAGEGARPVAEVSFSLAPLRKSR